MHSRELLFANVTEDELNNLVGGKSVPHATPWAYGGAKLKKDEFGALIITDGHRNKPVAFIVDDEHHQRLFTRFAQLRSDFSPLSSWAHIFTPRLFPGWGELYRVPELSMYEAAWTGLAIAEAQLLSGTNVPQVRIASCYATQTFAIARTLALWPQISLDDISSTYEQTRKLLRSAANLKSSVAGALQPVWEIFYELTNTSKKGLNRRHGKVIRAIDNLQNQGPSASVTQKIACLEPLLGVTRVAGAVMDMDKLTPEQRLNLFDEVVSELSRIKADNRSEEYIALTLLAGFISTIAAGGAPSLSLAESQASSHPAILAWAYSVGSLGENITWTSSFDGLGRLVVRELLRPFHLDEAPTSDFCFREMKALVDPALNDPLVHLRIKQARTVSVALFPGVSVTFALSDQRPERPTSVPARAPAARTYRGNTANELMPMLAEALMPYLREQLTRARVPVQYSQPIRTNRKKKTDQEDSEANLPFADPSKK